MNPALPLLVLGHAPGTTAVEVVPRPRLERMEARVGARFTPVPKGAAALTFPDYSREVVSEVERLLERGRTETMALAEDEAARALADAERLLRAHPELPQAAWLMAERHQLAALLAEKTQSAGAEELRRRAAVLEPERALAFGQSPTVAGAGGETFELALRGTAAHDSLEWDGLEQSFPARVRHGEHHLRVVRANTLVWAGWVTAAPGAPVLHVDVAPLTCSFAELGGTQSSAQKPIPPAGVSCPAWAVLRSERGRIELSLCHRSECGAWRSEPPVQSQLPTPLRDEREARIPRWVTIALAGAGAALFTTVTLWQTGAFERDERKTTRWSYEGFVPPPPNEED